jgi:sec-independent protein translocase protein TatA
MRLGTGELLIIFAVILLVFGPNKIPQFGDALGRGIRNFKRATTEADAPESGGDTTPALSAATPSVQAASRTGSESETARAQKA